MAFHIPPAFVEQWEQTSGPYGKLPVKRKGSSYAYGCAKASDLVGLTKHTVGLLMLWVRQHMPAEEWMRDLRYAGVGNKRGAGLTTTKGLAKVLGRWIKMYNAEQDTSSRIGYIHVTPHNEADVGRDVTSSAPASADAGSDTVKSCVWSLCSCVQYVMQICSCSNCVT